MYQNIQSNRTEAASNLDNDITLLKKVAQNLDHKIALIRKESTERIETLINGHKEGELKSAV
jgi:hypothetical protein